MFGGQSFGTLYPGGFIYVTQELTSGEILSELEGLELKAGEIKSELEGSGYNSEFLSELEGLEQKIGEIKSELSGTYDRPKRLGYRVIIKDKAGNSLGELINYRSIKFGKRLNNYGQAEFDIMTADPKAATFISLRKNTIEIHREINTSLTKVWAGEQATSRAELKDSGDNWASVYCFSWFEQLFHRYTAAEVIFSDTDQGAIASSLINTTNALDQTRVNVGTVATTKDRDREYNNQNIGEAIINLANLSSGFDFEVDEDGDFNADWILGADKTNSVIFKYGHNIKNATVIEDFSSPVNKAIVLGEATTETTLQRVERNDAALQAEYGLREDRLQEMDIVGISTLQDKGDAAIRKYGVPLFKVEFELVRNLAPSIDSFDVGDGIRLIIQDGIYDIDEQFRVFEWEVTYDSAGTEKLKLTLGNFITI